MKIVVVDGQGGKLGRQLVERISAEISDSEITAIGTNSIATQAMLKGGADSAATGENALVVACRKADIIVGPIGIVISDALMGEISPSMANAVGSSLASKVLIPVNKCDSYIMGIENVTVSEMIESAIKKIKELAE